MSYAADDFAALHARMEELRRDRAQIEDGTEQRSPQSPRPTTSTQVPFGDRPDVAPLIWRTANWLCRRHGEDAEFQACRLADLMLDCSDYEGQLIWLRIKRAIVQLLNGPAGQLH